MSKLLSALFATAMLGTTYGVYAGDGACNHAKKDVNAAVETDRLQLASGYPESGANTTGAGDMTDDTGATGNTSSGATDATTGTRSGTGASGGTGSTGTGTDATDATTSGSTATDNSPTGSGTSGSGATTGDM